MVKRRAKADVTQKMASADVMMNATQRSNAAAQRGKAVAYYYGNMGDSIERRYNGYDGGSLLGGGNDAFQGTSGGSNSWNAQGYGNYFGSGLINGQGRMFSGVHNGQGNGGFSYLKRFSSNATFNHNLIAQCMMAYLGYGTVRNIIDLYADFATENIEIEHPDKSARNFFRTWARKVNLNERIHSMFLNLFVSGQVFVHRRWATLDDGEKRAMKRADASNVAVINGNLVVKGKSVDTTIDGRENSFIDWFLQNGHTINKKAVAVKSDDSPQDADLPENSDKKIPWGYTFLNPLQMELRGKKIRGQSYWIMALDKRDTLEIARGMGMRSYQELGTTEVNIPSEFLSRVKAYQGPGGAYAAEVQLSTEELSVIHAPGKWDWFDWAVPFVYPALRALYYKDVLRTMEIRAAQSVINSIFLFKLGKMKEGMPAEPDHFERLADMLQMPGQVMNILWNEAIEAEVLQPKVDDIFNVDKHESADRDIMTALGVPEVLIGGKGGNFSNSYIAVATVLERLESYRNKVSDWLMGELKVIADAMGFQKLPVIKFGRTSLQDEKAHQTFLLGLYDRNILSADEVLKEIDTDVVSQADKLKEEEELRGTNVLEPRGPFVKPPPGAEGDMPKTPNGRPSGTSTGPTGKQSTPRAPKGKGIAEILEMQEILQDRGKAILAHLEDFIGKRILQAKAKENPGLKHLKQLRLEERERMEQLIYNVFSHMPVPQSEAQLEDEFIINILKSGAAESVKQDVLDIYNGKVNDYSITFNKVPTREMRRQFIVSAWTQRAIMEHLTQKPNIF